MHQARKSQAHQEHRHSSQIDDVVDVEAEAWTLDAADACERPIEAVAEPVERQARSRTERRPMWVRHERQRTTGERHADKGEHREMVGMDGTRDLLRNPNEKTTFGSREQAVVLSMVVGRRRTARIGHSAPPSTNANTRGRPAQIEGRIRVEGWTVHADMNVDTGSAAQVASAYTAKLSLVRLGLQSRGHPNASSQACLLRRTHRKLSSSTRLSGADPPFYIGPSACGTSDTSCTHPISTTARSSAIARPPRTRFNNSVSTATRPGAHGAILMHAPLPIRSLGWDWWPAACPVQVHFAQRDPLRQMFERACAFLNALTRVKV